MKKIAVVLMAVLLIAAAGLQACKGYSSHYNAFGLVQNNTSREASAKFNTLQGTMTYRLKATEKDEAIKFRCTLESGSLSVYYDCGPGRELLFKASGGDVIEDHGGRLQPGTVYVIVETEGTCRKGGFRFELGGAGGQA